MNENEMKATAFDKKYSISSNSPVDPWHIIKDVPGPEIVDQAKFDLRGIDSPDHSSLFNLQKIFEDILAGDPEALKRPEFQSLNIDAIVEALNWIMTTNIAENVRNSLLLDSWRLTFKPVLYGDGSIGGPPTMSQFMTRHFIGPMADSLYQPVKDMLIDFWDPLKPTRTLCACGCIGMGKAQTLNSIIYESEKKWFFMGDAKIGQKILTPYGESKIKAIYPWGAVPTYKIKLSNGQYAKCNAQHIWPVSYRKDANGEKIVENVTTQFIMDNKAKYRFEVLYYPA